MTTRSKSFSSTCRHFDLSDILSVELMATNCWLLHSHTDSSLSLNNSKSLSLSSFMIYHPLSTTVPLNLIRNLLACFYLSVGLYKLRVFFVFLRTDTVMLRRQQEMSLMYCSCSPGHLRASLSCAKDSGVCLEGESGNVLACNFLQAISPVCILQHSVY